MPDSNKVLVIGLDGATWRLLDPLIAEGKLPNIKRLKESGLFGDLISSEPPTTFPAWKCYSTGKNPGKLGVFGMFYPDFKNKKISIPNSRSFKSKELWDYLGEADYKVGVINMPTTEPVKKVNGFMVGGPFSMSTGYTYPEELENVLNKKYNYKVFLEELIMAQDKEELTEPAKAIIKSRFEFVKDVIIEDSVDFLHVTIFHIDTLQHYIWGSPKLVEVWRYIDKKIGEILKIVDTRWTIILMSDHGFGKTKYKFNVNNWLETFLFK